MGGIRGSGVPPRFSLNRAKMALPRVATLQVSAIASRAGATRPFLAYPGPNVPVPNCEMCLSRNGPRCLSRIAPNCGSQNACEVSPASVPVPKWPQVCLSRNGPAAMCACPGMLRNARPGMLPECFPEYCPRLCLSRNVRNVPKTPPASVATLKCACPGMCGMCPGMSRNVMWCGSCDSGRVRLFGFKYK